MLEVRGSASPSAEEAGRTSTEVPLATRHSTMVPESSDWVSFITFMASMMQTTVSAFTVEPSRRDSASRGRVA
jgi:hypothetical protein